MAALDAGASPSADFVAGQAELTVAWVGDHEARARKEMPSPLRRPRLLALATAMGRGFQRIEDLAFQVYADSPLQFAGGALLNRWGALVGEPRGQLGDADYRRFVEARIRANRCTGTRDELIAIWRKVATDETVDEIRLFDLFPASYSLQVIRRSGPMLSGRRRRVGRLMRAAKPAGVAQGLVVASAQPFQFGGLGFGAGQLAGVI